MSSAKNVTAICDDLLLARDCIADLKAAGFSGRIALEATSRIGHADDMAQVVPPVRVDRGGEISHQLDRDSKRDRRGNI